MKMDGRRKIIVAVTGASGSVYARLLCEALSRVAELGEIALIVTGNGRRVAAFEDGDKWLSDSRFTRYDDDDLFAAPASGSASYDAMAVIPCSMGTVGRIASGVSDNLVCRAADVMLKERRRLILVTREAPLSDRGRRDRLSGVAVVLFEAGDCRTTVRNDRRTRLVAARR